MAGPLFLGGPTTEGKYPPDFLKWEEEAHFSREVSSITAGASAITLQAGTVVEAVSAGVVKEWDAGANDITGILFETITIPALATRKVVVIRRMAVVDGRHLLATGQTNAAVLTAVAASIVAGTLANTILVRAGA